VVVLVIGLTATLGFVALGLGFFILDKPPPASVVSASLANQHTYRRRVGGYALCLHANTVPPRRLPQPDGATREMP
jgi:hypothetical protein